MNSVRLRRLGKMWPQNKRNSKRRTWNINRELDNKWKTTLRKINKIEVKNKKKEDKSMSLSSSMTLRVFSHCMISH